MLPDRDVLLPDPDGLANASRFFLAVFADHAGAQTLAYRIRKQFVAHTARSRPDVGVVLALHPLAPLPPYDTRSPWSPWRHGSRAHCTLASAHPPLQRPRHAAHDHEENRTHELNFDHYR